MAKKRKLTRQEQIELAEALLQWTANQKLADYYGAVLRQAIAKLQKAIALNASPLENASVFYEAQRQEKLIAAILDVTQVFADTNVEAAGIVSQWTTKAGDEAFVGALYALHVAGQELEDFTFYDTHAWQAIANGFNAGSTIPERLLKETARTQQELKDILLAGITNGEDSAVLASHVAERGSKLYRYARGVLHNEMGRVYSAGQELAMQQAQAAGVTALKTWYSNRDKRVRSDHAKLDGQQRKVGEAFEVNGHTAQLPHGFGIASEDINCRCRVHLTREGRDIIRTANGKDFDDLAQFKSWARNQRSKKKPTRKEQPAAPKPKDVPTYTHKQIDAMSESSLRSLARELGAQYYSGSNAPNIGNRTPSQAVEALLEGKSRAQLAKDVKGLQKALKK